MVVLRSQRRAGPLPRAWYRRDPVLVARAAIGRELVHDSPAGRVSGIIVETEAYSGATDAASHAFRGRTERNAVMFGPPGFSYLYFIYGMHFCLNLVTGREGVASAVLIRALQPVTGIPLMIQRRGVDAVARLARGPGNVASALGLTRAHNGLDLTVGPLWLSNAPLRRGGLPVVSGPRVGIRVEMDRPWRFFLAGHPCVSPPRVVTSEAPAGRRTARVGGRLSR